MRLFFWFSLCFSAIACNNTSSGPTQKSSEFVDLPKDFLNFYNTFHTDSAYQIAHIEWPLKGEKAEKQPDGSAKKVLTIWEPETWQMLHMPDLNDPGLKRSYETMSDVLIIEKMQYPMVNYGLERQFFKEENNEWKLIYYSEMQEL
ncbi:MAG: DUF4348 domain-containing protein [Saprospiraceae bacterium]|nr:DUF4348 domain-containing protein [Saprospiraceae bacterium]